MNIIPIKTPILKKNAVQKLIKIIKKRGIHVVSGDVLVVTTKLISFDEERLINLKNIKVSKTGLKLAKKYSIEPALVEIIIRESDKIRGGSKGALLTIKDGILIANAGIDQSNVPTNSIALWPENPAKSAERIKKLIKKEFNANVGIILSDSHCLPLRLGTTAVAIAIAGFLGVIDLRNKADLFGRKLKITLTNVADQLASAANILMGEASEHIPAVLVKDAPIKLSSKSAKKLTRALIIPRNECLFREYNKKI